LIFRSVLNEQKIISGCKAKDKLSQKAFVDQYAKYLYGVCLRYTREANFANDCLQESLIQILNNIDKYHEQGKFKSWCAKVTSMKCLNMMRKEKSSRLDFGNENLNYGVAENVHLKMEKDEVLKFVDQLPQNYRIALNMFLVEGYAHKEIAEHLNVTVGTSRSLVSRGRQMIQQAFSEDNMQIVFKKDQTKNDDRKRMISFFL